MVMIIEFEVDRSAFIITINSFRPELTKDDCVEVPELES